MNVIMKKNSECNLVNWKKPLKTMLIDELGGKYTYGQIKDEINKYKTKIRAGGLVIICASNDLGSIIWYLICLENRNPVLILEQGIAQNMMSKYINIYQPDYLILRKDQEPKVEGHSFEFESHGYKIYRQNRQKTTHFYDELKLLMTTSGSTGDPKLVRLSSKNIISNADSIISYLKITEKDVAITSLPINYSYGLSVINSHLRAGGTIALNKRSIIESKFWDAVNENSVTNIAGVPFTYELILKLDFSKYFPTSVRLLTQAGGSLGVSKVLEAHEKSNAAKIKFYVMYGQTEASPRMTYLDPMNLPSKAGSIGIPIPGGSIWLENEAGEKIHGDGIVGELIYAGPNVALGYASNRIDLLKGDEWNGILKTGDLAFRDQDGFYYLHGRRSRFIKISGIRISLDQIEKEINTQEIVAAASGRDDFLAVLIEGDFNQEKINIVTATLRAYKIPKKYYKIEFKPNLKRSKSGKLDYKQFDL